MSPPRRSVSARTSAPRTAPRTSSIRTPSIHALELGINVLDTAVNYRHQRSERAIRTALGAAIGRGVIRRDEVVVATKGGFIPFDGSVPRDPRAYFATTYVETGIIKPGDVAKGGHCMTPRYLRDQIDRSRANLGVETLDVYYIHNPETQLGEVSRAEFLTRMRAAFGALEEAVATGSIAQYGTATWTGYRVDPGDPGYLSLSELVAVAQDAGGADHHFKVIQLPYNLGMTEAFTRANQRVKDRVVPVLEAARELAISVIASASLHQGQLTRSAADDGGVRPGPHDRRAARAPVRALDARHRHGARRNENIGPCRRKRDGRHARADGLGAVPAPVQRGGRLIPGLVGRAGRARSRRKTLHRATASGRVNG